MENVPASDLRERKIAISKKGLKALAFNGRIRTGNMDEDQRYPLLNFHLFPG